LFTFRLAIGWNRNPTGEAAPAANLLDDVQEWQKRLVNADACTMEDIFAVTTLQCIDLEDVKFSFISTFPANRILGDI
jgi:hypothetical protein